MNDATEPFLGAELFDSGQAAGGRLVWELLEVQEPDAPVYVGLVIDTKARKQHTTNTSYARLDAYEDIDKLLVELEKKIGAKG